MTSAKCFTWLAASSPVSGRQNLRQRKSGHGLDVLQTRKRFRDSGAHRVVLEDEIAVVVDLLEHGDEPWEVEVPTARNASLNIGNINLSDPIQARRNA